MRAKNFSGIIILVLCLSFIAAAWSWLFTGSSGVEINASNFPDYKFREEVREYFDKDNDGTLSDEEIINIKMVNVNELNIASLKGIEFFTALIILECNKNQLKELDVSKNTALTTLRCYKNQLTELDVSKNTALTELWCGANQLRELDVSKNTRLTQLWLWENQLREIDVSKNKALTQLYCDRQTKIIR